jgi:hypothetical protein
VAGHIGLELANVIFRKPLIMLGKISFASPNIGTERPFGCRSATKDRRNDICEFESSQPSHGVEDHSEQISYVDEQHRIVVR